MKGLRAIKYVVTVVFLVVISSNGWAHTDVTPQEAKSMIDTNDNLIVVDVREEASEYCDEAPTPPVPPGHIPGALNYPWSSGVLQERYAELPIDGEILIVCRSGSRSNQAAEFLDSKGYLTIYDMTGGMSAWLWETVGCVDTDSDDLNDDLDNCPNEYNPNQEDIDLDGIGDVCDDANMCRGLADYDQDVDAADLTIFLSQFGRGQYSNPCPPDGPTPVAKTGQTTSYATGDDGDLERGVAMALPRFTDNDDGTVTDNQTGLIWLQNANCFGSRTWNNALSDCNGLAAGDNVCLGGVFSLTDGSQPGDWRLPNYKELFSLVDAENLNPPLPTEHPFSNVQPWSYWSSTAYSGPTNDAWGVSMVYGNVNFGDMGFLYHVWPVRGGH